MKQLRFRSWLGEGLNAQLILGVCKRYKPPGSFYVKKCSSCGIEAADMQGKGMVRNFSLRY